MLAPGWTRDQGYFGHTRSGTEGAKMEVLAKDHGIPRPWRAEGGGVAEPFEGLRVLRR
jgi:hypothetical protein